MKTLASLERLSQACEVMQVSDAASPVLLSIVLPADAGAIGLDAFPPGALPQTGRIANGRGIDEHSCQSSGLGEAAELFSCCNWGDEERVHSAPAGLSGPALLPNDLLGYSADQLAERADWNEAMGGLDWRPAPHETSDPIDWLPVTDAYSSETCFAPADFVLIGRREAGDGAAVAVADSNGCACGPDLQSARLSALLELVERDAVARWWYGCRSRPALEISDHHLPSGFSDWFAGRGRQYWFVDVRTDIDIPVVAALSADQAGKAVAIASAAAMDWPLAIDSAATELVQMEFSLDLARNAPGMSATWDHWLRSADMTTPPMSLIGQETTVDWATVTGSVETRLATCLAACQAASVSVYFRDMTRPELDIPAVRALSTDLCPYKPRFGRSRLLAPDRRDLSVAKQIVPNPVCLTV